MTEQPAITSSSRDSGRLEALLDSLAPNNFSEADMLRAELERAMLLEPEKMPGNVVTMNSKVRFFGGTLWEGI